MGKKGKDEGYVLCTVRAVSSLCCAVPVSGRLTLLGVARLAGVWHLVLLHLRLVCRGRRVADVDDVMSP